MHRVLAINPGSTSTKFAVYNEAECFFTKTIRHPLEQLLRYKNIIDQFAFRKGLIIDALVEEGIEVDSIKYIKLLSKEIESYFCEIFHKSFTLSFSVN